MRCCLTSAWKLAAVSMASLVILFVSATQAFADSEAEGKASSGLSITYDAPLRCGVPTTFYLSVNDGDSESAFKYHLDYVKGFDPLETTYSVVDASRQAWLSQWSEDGRIEFTFYASGTYDLRFQALEQSGSPPFRSFTKRISLTIDDPAYPSLPTKARQLVAQANAEGCTTDFDKALWLHDWILDHCTYDYSLLYCNAEGALARGKGTCEAYHRAFVLLLNTAGIQTASMAGNGHRWTAAKLDGKWYQIDVTWDDYEVELVGTYPDLTHLYFGLNDALMKVAHSDHESVAGYECDSLEDNYFIKTREIEQWSAFAIPLVQSAIDDQRSSFQIPVQYPDMVASYRDILYGLVAYDIQARQWSSGSREVTLAVTYADGVLGVKASYADAPKPPVKPPDSQPIIPGKPSVRTQDMHRLYNPNSGEHFYTVHANERDHLVSAGWSYEGVAWKAPVSGQPVYRMYNANAGDHHYTMSTHERDSLIGVGWSYEGVGWYSDTARAVPLYRLYNPNAVAGAHHYTTSAPERESLKSVGWHDEGIAWFGH